MNLTPQQKLKKEILLAYYEDKYPEQPADKTYFYKIIEKQNPYDSGWWEDRHIDEIYEDFLKDDEAGNWIEDIRCSGKPSFLDHPKSKKYDVRSVAMKTCDGTWVGWNFWSGGKEADIPEQIEWMESAYDVECIEEEQKIVVFHFRRINHAR